MNTTICNFTNASLMMLPAGFITCASGITASGFTYGGALNRPIWNNAGRENVGSTRLWNPTAEKAWSSRTSLNTRSHMPSLVSGTSLAAAASLAGLLATAWPAVAYGRPDSVDDFAVIHGHSEYKGVHNSAQQGQAPQLSDLCIALGLVLFLSWAVSKAGSMVETDPKKGKKQGPMSIQ